MARLITLAMVAAAMIVVGCGNTSDDEALAVAESFPIADTEIRAAPRIERVAVAGRPDSAFPSYAKVLQVYRTDGELRPVYDELRELAGDDNWIIDEVDEDGGWRSAAREEAGRRFRLRTGFDPETDQVFLWLDQLPPEIGE